MYYIQVDTTGYVGKGSFVVHGEPYKVIGELKDARKFKTFEAAYNALDRMIDSNYNLDLVCIGNCYMCPYNEECDNSYDLDDELLDDLDEW